MNSFINIISLASVMEDIFKFLTTAKWEFIPFMTLVKDYKLK
jgi:hypothetical protein